MAAERPVRRLVVPSLVLSRVVFQPYTLITMLMLIEIARTFDMPVGVAGLL